jgi:predicted permease
VSNIPFGGDYSDSVILAEGYQMKPGESIISPYSIVVSPGYFEAMGVKPVEGRVFADSDTETSQQVVIVDQKLARKFWGTASPLGRRMYKPDSAEDVVKPGPKAHWYTVIGVVPEIRIAGYVSADERVGAYYMPLTQNVGRTITLAVKAESDPSAITPLLRRELASLDPELPLYSVMTMGERMKESLLDRRTPMVLAAVFGGVALFLAAVGIYGVLAYQVSQRGREIGIRLALGSDTARVFRMILSEGLALLVAGLVVGLVGAFAIRGALQTQLYGIGAMDPLVLTAVAALLGAVTVVACSVPARRAAKIDPMRALAER